ncbi:hypothetical protein EV401DRAFT_1890563 [Pisolithus croceorrhizus]|nr:hypothetical protein EV401DRAFT_1890563 [Pisolithus croceorrhizus]
MRFIEHSDQSVRRVEAVFFKSPHEDSFHKQMIANKSTEELSLIFSVEVLIFGEAGWFGVFGGSGPKSELQVIVSGKVGNVEIHSSSTTDLLDSPCNPTMFLQELEWSDEHQNTRSSHESNPVGQYAIPLQP